MTDLTLEIIPNKPIPDDVYQAIDAVLRRLVQEAKLFAYAVDPDAQQLLLDQVIPDGGEAEEVPAS